MQKFSAHVFENFPRFLCFAYGKSAVKAFPGQQHTKSTSNFQLFLIINIICNAMRRSSHRACLSHLYLPLLRLFSASKSKKILHPTHIIYEEHYLQFDVKTRDCSQNSNHIFCLYCIYSVCVCAICVCSCF